MWKLVSEEGRWSFLNGYQIYDFVVYLMDKEEVTKYSLIDEDGNKIEKNLNDCLVEIKLKN